jgi:hypothetical protein
MDGLESLYCVDGVLLDGFIEKTFAWDRDPGDGAGVTGYDDAWVGFVHNPPHVPPWFNKNRQSPLEILCTPEWRHSMHSCKGLFTLSSYLKDWLSPQVPVRVCNLLAPTETPENRFSMVKFRLNDDKKLIQVGWWLRKFHSLYHLPVNTRRKVLLSLGDSWTDEAHAAELSFVRDPSDFDSVQVIPYLCNDDYDELLSKNIVFLDLYDSSFNNAIVECIVRATPLLVNPLPAVVEYLGEGYPFYFESLDQASGKAEDEALILATHEYLEAWPLRKLLTRDHFLQSFIQSDIYQALPSTPSGLWPVDKPDRGRAACASELTDEWNRAAAGDGRARALWQLVEGGRWTWEANALYAGACGSEWSAVQWSLCGPGALKALKNFVVEVTVGGVGGAAGLSLGPYKDFLADLKDGCGERHLQLLVDSSENNWTFRVDGEVAECCWWNSSVRSTADLIGGSLTLKARHPGYVWFRNLTIHGSLPGSAPSPNATADG